MSDNQENAPSASPSAGITGEIRSWKKGAPPSIDWDEESPNAGRERVGEAQGDGTEAEYVPPIERVKAISTHALLEVLDFRFTAAAISEKRLLAAHDALKAERDARFAESCAEIETLKVVRDALAARVAELEKVGAEMAGVMERIRADHDGDLCTVLRDGIAIPSGCDCGSCEEIDKRLAAFRALTAPKETERE